LADHENGACGIGYGPVHLAGVILDSAEQHQQAWADGPNGVLGNLHSRLGYS